MRNYTAAKYKDLVEDIDDEVLQEYMRDETEFIAGVDDAKDRTFVDLGAGYGRVVPFLSSIGKEIVAIEINPEMYRGLAELAQGLPNVSAIKGDFFKLSEILPASSQKPVFLILQNSLGTIEGGEGRQVMEVVTSEAVKRQGSLILSLLRQPALKTYGVSMYGKLQGMVGNVDVEKSDFDAGSLVTDTGYTSKWWTDAEIDDFKQMGRLVRQKITPEYALLEIDFSGQAG